MLNKFREDLEQLLHNYAKVGIKLTDVNYDIVDTYYFDKEKDKGGSYKDIENLKFIVEVSDNG